MDGPVAPLPPVVVRSDPSIDGVPPILGQRPLGGLGDEPESSDQQAIGGLGDGPSDG